MMRIMGLLLNFTCSMNHSKSITTRLCALIFLEWFDFSVYLSLAPSVFAKHFFATASTGVMASFLIFAIAFLARPLGGMWFGRQADIRGRQPPLVLTALLMGLATLGIGILPQYQDIGFLAIVGLLLLRLIQSFALGGENNNAAMFLVEHSAENSLRAGSLAAAASAFGIGCGSVLSTLMQVFDLLAYWRLVFIVGGCFSLWLWQQRKNMTESPVFKAQKRPLSQIWQYRDGLVDIAILGLFTSVSIYLCNIYWVGFTRYYPLFVHASTAGVFASAAQCLAACFTILLGAYVPAKYDAGLLKISTGMAMLAAPCLFFGTIAADESIVGVGLLAYIALNACLSAGLYRYLHNCLPTAFRCFGVSTAWAGAASIGALSLPFAEYLRVCHHIDSAAGVLVLVCALATFFRLARLSSRYTIMEGI